MNEYLFLSPLGGHFSSINFTHLHAQKPLPLPPLLLLLILLCPYTLPTSLSLSPHQFSFSLFLIALEFWNSVLKVEDLFFGLLFRVVGGISALDVWFLDEVLKTLPLNLVLAVFYLFFWWKRRHFCHPPVPGVLICMTVEHLVLWKRETLPKSLVFNNWFWVFRSNTENPSVESFVLQRSHFSIKIRALFPPLFGTEIWVSCSLLFKVFISQQFLVGFCISFSKIWVPSFLFFSCIISWSWCFPIDVSNSLWNPSLRVYDQFHSEAQDPFSSVLLCCVPLLVLCVFMKKLWESDHLGPITSYITYNTIKTQDLVFHHIY